MEIIKVTYNLHQLWNQKGSFYEVLKALIDSPYVTQSRNEIQGFVDLHVSVEDLRFFCSQFKDSNGIQYPFWSILKQVQLLCVSSWLKELDKYGEQVSSISCSGIECWVKAPPQLKDTFTDPLFPGGLIDQETPSYKSFEEWNVNGTYQHIEGKVFTQLRVNNTLPSLQFILNFINWSTQNSLEIELLFKEEYQAVLP